MKQSHTVESVNTRVFEKHGGQCLSIERRPTGKYTQLHGEFRCAKGHVWKTFVNGVMNKGSWCRQCRSRAVMSEVHDVATDHGGECLSETITSTDDRLRWKCSEGHIWEQKYYHVKRGVWCKKCSDKSHRMKQEDINAIAESRGGRCLSVYVSYAEPLLWECAEGHQWLSRINSIKDRSSWCTDCRNKSESFCRIIFEQLLGIPFRKERPEWLKNIDGNRLELDGFNPDLKIAFEFNGAQHYEIQEWMGGKTEEDLNKQKEHDAIKLRECESRGIRLIVIPHTCKTISQKSRHICEELTKIGQTFDIKNLRLH